MQFPFLIMSYSEARASTGHIFREGGGLPLDFHDLWHSMMSKSLFTEIKQQRATLVLGWLTTSVHYLCL